MTNYVYLIYFKSKHNKEKRIIGWGKKSGGTMEIINLKEPSLSYNFFILKASEWQR